ncbi:hypothetical protein OPV22_003158 [Ensete ventricosum]|uniref:Uncharacterized protein n=1 Tax=Ensete ventricosum TaxID=4639 RepID=A0AAV8S065_ENSVE|nr:hypothetical protein OPV22_003158 [Ensete ventricosum]
MKASLELREDRSPLLRAKFPLTAFGLPFLSAFSAGDPRDLRLDLSTAFDAGPVVRLSYRPNLTRSPFCLAVRMGTGALGSPIAAPFTMCAEFNPLAWGGGSPFFSVVFKPRLGDFSLKRIARSGSGTTTTPPPPPPPPAGFVSTGPENGFHDGKRVNGFASGVASVDDARSLLSGTELRASSVLPLRGPTALRFRWGIRLPAELRIANGEGPAAGDGISFRRFPQLVMTKITIEHMAEGNKAREQKSKSATGEVAEPWSSVRQHLEALRAENGVLKRDVRQLCAEVFARRQAPTSGVAAEVKEWRGVERGGKAEMRPPPPSARTDNKDRRIDGKSLPTGAKARPEDVNEELKKALMAATGSSRR